MKKIFEDVEENTTEGFLEDLRSKAPEYFNSEGKFTGKGGSITVDGKKIQIPREIFMANKLETLKHKPNNPIGILIMLKCSGYSLIPYILIILLNMKFEKKMIGSLLIKNLSPELGVQLHLSKQANSVLLQQNVDHLCVIDMEQTT